MKKIAIFALVLVLTACLMTACGSRTANETSIPTTTKMPPQTTSTTAPSTQTTTQPTVPATTGNQATQDTNGGGVVEDIIEDITGGSTSGSAATTESGRSRSSASNSR